MTAPDLDLDVRSLPLHGVPCARCERPATRRVETRWQNPADELVVVVRIAPCRCVTSIERAGKRIR